jgi:hypothetical protein
MTKLILTTAAVLFTVSAHAADSYQQFVQGNPDSDNTRAHYTGVQAQPPGVGADISRYQGFGEGNPDLFEIELGRSPKSQSPEIYGAAEGNPDLSF